MANASNWTHAGSKPLLTVLCCVVFVSSGCSEDSTAAAICSNDTHGILRLAVPSDVDFGRLTTGSPRVSRQVNIDNPSTARVRVLRWTISCDCLTVYPAAVTFEPGESKVIQLVFDPGKEGKSFSGNLLISVDAEGVSGFVGGFQVPACIIASPETAEICEDRMSAVENP